MISDFDSVIVVRKQRRGKSLRLTVRQDGTIVLSLPRWVSVSAGKKFLLSKKEWILEAQKKAQSLPPRLLNQGDQSEYLAHKEEARRVITERVEYFQKIYGFSYRKLSVRNQKSRFGSCSASGQLSFNYRLLFLPQDLLDYVVVHELCHLRELNHSGKFWALVAKEIPDYQERKHRLQAFSRSSH